MADKFLENQVCENCGAEKRLNAVFCYNCGFQVADDELVEAESSKSNKISNAWFKDSITEVSQTENIAPISNIDSKKIEPKAEIATESKSKITKQSVKEKVKESTKIKDETSLKEKETSIAEKTSPSISTVSENTEDLSKLKTASSLRQKTRFAPKKTVEVVWDAPKSTPNIWFLIVSLILLGLAVFAVFAMLYIR